jgi:hypothetical protein
MRENIKLILIVLIFVLTLGVNLKVLYNTPIVSKEINLSCNHYNSVPEKYISRVPDRCLGQYFDRKAKEAEAFKKRQMDIIKDSVYQP